LKVGAQKKLSINCIKVQNQLEKGKLSYQREKDYHRINVDEVK